MDSYHNQQRLQYTACINSGEFTTEGATAGSAKSGACNCAAPTANTNRPCASRRKQNTLAAGARGDAIALEIRGQVP